MANMLSNLISSITQANSRGQGIVPQQSQAESGGFLAQLASNPLVQMDQQRRKQEHIAKVYAANPQFGEALYGRGGALTQLASDQGSPSAVREYQFYQSLPPEEREDYLRIKRAQQNLDFGGTYEAVDPVTGQLRTLGRKTPGPESLPAFKASQTEAVKNAEIKAEKESQFPRVQAQVDNNISIIDEALNHPGFDANFGKMGILPNIPGSEASDARTYLDQIQGTAFLTALGEMKGTGAISEKEGDAATAAVARLGKAQSAQSARKALSDLKEILNGAKLRAAKGTSYEQTVETPNSQVTQVPNPSNYSSKRQYLEALRKWKSNQ